MAGSEHVALEVGGQVGSLIAIEPVVGTHTAGGIVPECIRSGNERTRLTNLEHETAPDHGPSLAEPASPGPAETGCYQDDPGPHLTCPGYPICRRHRQGDLYRRLSPSS